jgi:hypothetical protein
MKQELNDVKVYLGFRMVDGLMVVHEVPEDGKEEFLSLSEEEQMKAIAKLLNDSEKFIYTKSRVIHTDHIIHVHVEIRGK